MADLQALKMTSEEQEIEEMEGEEREREEREGEKREGEGSFSPLASATTPSSSEGHS